MIIREVTFAAENGYIEVTGGSSGIVTPITPAYTTDATEPADQTASDQIQDNDCITAEDNCESKEHEYQVNLRKIQQVKKHIP